MPTACKEEPKSRLSLDVTLLHIVPTCRPNYKQKEQGGLGLEKLAQDSPEVSRGLISFILPTGWNELGSRVRRKGFLTLLCGGRGWWRSSGD